MWSKASEAHFPSILFHHMPNYALGDAVTPALSSPTNATKYRATCYARSASPRIQGRFHPAWHRHGPDVPTLADQIDDGPVLLPLLYVGERQIRELAPAQSAAKQGRELRTVSFALERVDIRCLPKAASLLRREPVSKPHAEFFDALHPPNARGQLRAEQTRVGSLIS